MTMTSTKTNSLQPTLWVQSSVSIGRRILQLNSGWVMMHQWSMLGYLAAWESFGIGFKKRGVREPNNFVRWWANEKSCCMPESDQVVIGTGHASMARALHPSFAQNKCSRPSMKFRTFLIISSASWLFTVTAPAHVWVFELVFPCNMFINMHVLCKQSAQGIASAHNNEKGKRGEHSKGTCFETTSVPAWLRRRWGLWLSKLTCFKKVLAFKIF